MSDPSEKYDLFNTPESAELYSKHQPPLHGRVIETVLASTTGRELFIDIGCGSGSSTRPFAPHFARVLGVDYSPEQIAFARKLNKELPNVEYHQGSLYELPVPDYSVDCILGVMIAQFIDIPLFYKEVERVLKPGGVVVFHGKSAIRVAQIESETESNTTVSELNQRIVYIKTKLFAGLWHDRTHFNPLKYTNIPTLFPHHSPRAEWVMSDSFTIAQLAGYMLTWSAAGCYCANEGVKTWELKVKLVDMLRCGDTGLGSVRCEHDGFTWCSVKPGPCS